MALIVEDGTGLVNADSYVSVADATTYHANYGNDAWADLDPTTQEIYLRKASRDADMIYGPSYRGERMTTTQALLFPRSEANYYFNMYQLYGSYGLGYVPSNTDAVSITGIPANFKNAIAELALLNVTADVTAPTDGSGNLSENTIFVGDLRIIQKAFMPTSEAASMLRKVSLIMRPYLKTDPFGVNVSVERG